MKSKDRTQLECSDVEEEEEEEEEKERDREGERGRDGRRPICLFFNEKIFTMQIGV